MAMSSHVSFCFFVMHISGSKFEDNRSNIDIVDSVFYHFSCTAYDVISLLICMIQRRLEKLFK